MSSRSQQVPEDIERVMVGVEAYLSIRKHTSDTGLSFFENDDENGEGLSDKVGSCLANTLLQFTLSLSVL